MKKSFGNDGTRPRRYRYVRLRWRVLFAVIDFAATALFAAVGAVRRRIAPRTPPSGRPRDPQVILLVQLDHLGDAIVSTAILPALRERYPRASIEVLAGACNREVFEAAPQVDRVHVSRINRFARGGRLRWLWLPAIFYWGFVLRGRKVDLGIDVRGEFPLALLLWLCGARRRLGWDCGGGGFLLTDSPALVPDRPEVESRGALLAELGIRPSGPAAGWRPSFHPGVEARRKATRRWAGLAAEVGGSRVVVHVGAGTPAKRWPPGHWRELIGRLIVDHATRVALVGVGEDSRIAAHILGNRRWPAVADWTGRLSVTELAAVIQQADLLVGADSAPAQLAAAVATPVVVLFSGTNNPKQWQPCGRQVTVVRHEVDCSPCHCEVCPRADHPCMVRLAPRRVAAAAAEILCRSPRRVACPRLRGHGGNAAGNQPHAHASVGMPPTIHTSDGQDY